MEYAEYIKISVGVASGLLCTYIFSRALNYMVGRYFASIDERFEINEGKFEKNDETHKEIFHRLNCAEKNIGIINIRCEERDKREHDSEPKRN